MKYKCQSCGLVRNIPEDMKNFINRCHKCGGLIKPQYKNKDCI